MRKPEVSVVEIKRGDATIGPAKEVNLGDAKAEAILNKVLENCRGNAQIIFLLKWEGDKVPDGAVVLDQEISWTQNGLVTTSTGERIGTYQRLVEFGGETGKEQQMLIFLF